MSADAIAGANPDHLEAVEHVELGERDAGDAADRDRLTDEDRVEPAAAALSTGDRAEFVAALAELLADFIVLLGREWPRSDAGRVGLDDAEHETRGAGSHAAAWAGGACNGVGRSDERIGAVIDVEQNALRTFEQDSAAAALRFIEVAPHRLGERKDEIGDLGQVVQQALAIDRRLAKAGAQCIVVGAEAVELRPEFAEMGEV